MNKDEEDKIIAQANEILKRRSMNTIYFHESGFCDGNVWISAYIIKPNGEKAHYYNDGKPYEFACCMQDSVTFDASELPKEMLFSFRHGTYSFEADYSLRGYKWKLEDLKYKVVDEDEWNDEQQNIKAALDKIDGCKTIEDVYDIYDKHLRNRHIPHKVIAKAFNIAKVTPDLEYLFCGEIGMYGFQQTMMFVAIMEECGNKQEK